MGILMTLFNSAATDQVLSVHFYREELLLSSLSLTGIPGKLIFYFGWVSLRLLPCAFLSIQAFEFFGSNHVLFK